MVYIILFFVISVLILLGEGLIDSFNDRTLPWIKSYIENIKTKILLNGLIKSLRSYSVENREKAKNFLAKLDPHDIFTLLRIIANKKFRDPDSKFMIYENIIDALKTIKSNSAIVAIGEIPYNENLSFVIETAVKEITIFEIRNITGKFSYMKLTHLIRCFVNDCKNEKIQKIGIDLIKSELPQSVVDKYIQSIDHLDNVKDSLHKQYNIECLLAINYFLPFNSIIKLVFWGDDNLSNQAQQMLKNYLKENSVKGTHGIEKTFSLFSEGTLPNRLSLERHQLINRDDNSKIQIQGEFVATPLINKYLENIIKSNLQTIPNESCTIEGRVNLDTLSFKVQINIEPEKFTWSESESVYIGEEEFWVQESGGVNYKTTIPKHETVYHTFENTMHKLKVTFHQL